MLWKCFYSTLVSTILMKMYEKPEREHLGIYSMLSWKIMVSSRCNQLFVSSTSIILNAQINLRKTYFQSFYSIYMEFLNLICTIFQVCYLNWSKIVVYFNQMRKISKFTSEKCILQRKRKQYHSISKTAI